MKNIEHVQKEPPQKMHLGDTKSIHGKICPQHSFKHSCLNCLEIHKGNPKKKGQIFIMGGGNPYSLNENYFFELGCHQHRCDPLCIECMEERAIKLDLSWNKALELICEKAEEANDTTAINTRTNVKKTK